MDGGNPNVTDGRLLLQYARDRSEAAFAELVARHVDWIYSSACRQRCDPHLAEDVVQTVFILLARKAHTFDERVVVSAWLFRTLRFVIGDALRAQRHRRHHERELGTVMNASHPPARPTAASPDANWSDIAPALDDAVAGLGVRDRTAILLRFYEQKTHAQIGAALGVSEDAAKMRVSRAVDKLRAALARHGAALPAAVLVSLLTGHLVQAAPAQISSAAVSAAVAGVGTAGTASSLPWLKGLVLSMNVGKAVVVGCVAAAVVATVAVFVNRTPVASPPAVAAKASPAATSRDFREAYALPPGQVLKRMPPPFGDARHTYVKDVLRRQLEPGFFDKDEEPTSLALSWREGKSDPLKWQMFQTVKPDLGYVLQAVLGLRNWDIHAPPGVLETVVEGDWVVRETATPAERATALSQILREQVGLHVRVERKRINAEVIVVTGGNLSPPANAVQVYSDKLTDGKPDIRGTQNDFSDFLGQIQLVTKKRVLNESSTPDKTKIRSALHTSGMMGKMPPKRAVAKLDLILANLSRQTGLRFARATRPLEMWVITPEAAR